MVTQFLEGYIAKDPEAQEHFGKLNDEDRAKWIKEGRAIPRGLDFGEKVIGKFPWAEDLAGTITHQDNLAYAFMVGIEPIYQGIGLGSLLFQALEAQNYAKGNDAAMGEFTSISRVATRVAHQRSDTMYSRTVFPGVRNSVGRLL